MNECVTFSELSKDERAEALFTLGIQMVYDIAHDKFDAKKISNDEYWLYTIIRVKEELIFCEDDQEKIRHLCISVFTLCNREMMPYMMENILSHATFSRKVVDLRSIPAKLNVNARDN
jgi:hypothetical protein